MWKFCVFGVFDVENAVYWCFYAPNVVQNDAKVVQYDAKLLQKDAKLVQNGAFRHISETLKSASLFRV